MALLVEKASRNFITIYEKWSVVEALLGSGTVSYTHLTLPTILLV